MRERSSWRSDNGIRNDCWRYPGMIQGSRGDSDPYGSQDRRGDAGLREGQSGNLDRDVIPDLNDGLNTSMIQDQGWRLNHYRSKNRGCYASMIQRQGWRLNQEISNDARSYPSMINT